VAAVAAPSTMDRTPFRETNFWVNVQYDSNWDELIRESKNHPSTDPFDNLYDLLACRVFEDQRLCRYATGETQTLTVDPLPPGHYRSAMAHIDDAWRLDDRRVIPFTNKPLDSFHALVFHLECFGERQCEWGKDLITFEPRGKTPDGQDQYWAITDVTTPWCLRHDRTTVPQSLFYLRPLLAAVGAVICDLALVPDPDVPRPDARGQGRRFTLNGDNSPCVGKLISPRCALDTYWAAWLRRDEPLWRAVNKVNPPYWVTEADLRLKIVDDPARDINTKTYQIIGSYWLTDATIPDRYREKGDPEADPPPWHSGDVVIEFALWHYNETLCIDKTAEFCSGDADTPHSYVFRRDGSLWHFVSWQVIPR
jgi:hypothetical protein